MANAYWRTGNTRPAVIFPLNLGTDPETGEPRTLAETDVVTQIMRNNTLATPAIVRALDVVDVATNMCRYKPEDGDLDYAGTYQVVFDITDENGDVETLPDRQALDYYYQVDAKPGE